MVLLYRFPKKSKLFDLLEKRARDKEKDTQIGWILKKRQFFSMNSIAFDAFPYLACLPAGRGKYLFCAGANFLPRHIPLSLIITTL
ncbi:hypothetical protein HY407_00245 [Candidatus Gottesmanbacteria bacterium]|nr:hypothetical protein [Candidatus Gottesmanbacteria bacterium]